MDKELQLGELIKNLNSMPIPSKNELIILAIGADKKAFSSGMILRDTYKALGEPMSVTTVHRVLGALVSKKWVTEVGAMIDDVSARPAVGFAVSASGRRVLQHYAACADIAANAA